MDTDSPDHILRSIEELSESQRPRTLGIHRKETSSARFLPIIGPIKGKLLEDLIKKHQPDSVLEIGTLVGYSAILMAQHMRKGKIVSIEADEKAAEVARSNIERAGLSGKIEVIVGDAKQVIKELDEKFDFIFIDAMKEEYLDYLKAAESKMAKNCIVVADNAKVFAEHMKDYLEYVRLSGKYKSKFYDFGSDGVEVSIRT